MRPASKAGELSFISGLRARAAAQTSAALRLGIGDDCAVLRPPPGHDILLTTDFSLEGRHFRRDTHPAHSVGHRCLARGLSDLAAMGAKPLAAFLSLALPTAFLSTPKGRRWANEFLDGLFALAHLTGTPLAGGDTSAASGEAILADIVLVGSAPRGRELRRSGARPGDLLYVTGSLGGSAADLAALFEKPAKFRKAAASDDHPHLFPQPRLAVGQHLLRRGIARAAIDLSDGLSTDLQHLCHESGLRAVIDQGSLPIHPAAQALGSDAALRAALHGGEDYELLFTASPETRVPRIIAGVKITCIGTMLAGQPEIRLRDNLGKGELLQPAGWEHAL